MMNSYSAFGLTFRSTIPIPELNACSDDLSDPIDIVDRRLPPHLAGGQAYDAYMQYLDQRCLYEFPEIGRFLIENGNRITIDREPQCDPKDVRAFLLGSVMGTLLHQRQLIPLHVSVVRSPAGLVAFTGMSGAGKSTMAAVLNKRTGWPILTDDMSVLKLGPDGPELVGGVLRIKLWKDSLRLINPATKDIQQDATRFDKYHVRLGDDLSAEPGRFVALINLSEGNEVRLDRIRGGKAITLLLNAVYRPYLAGLFNDLGALSSSVFSSAEHIRIYNLTRPKRVDQLDQVVSVLMNEFGDS